MKHLITPFLAGALASVVVAGSLDGATDSSASPAPAASGESRGEPPDPAVPGKQETPDNPTSAPDGTDSPEDEDEPAWVAEVRNKVLPPLEEMRFDQAKEATAALLKAHPDIPEEDKARLMLHVTLEALIAKEDAAAALKAVDDIIAAYPNAGLGEEVPAIKRHIRTRIDSQQADEVMAKLAPLVDKESDPAKLRTAAKALLGERPKMNQNAKAIVMFRILVEPMVEAGDEAGAIRELAALAEAFPESDFVKEADSFKADMLERIGEQKVAAIMKPLGPMIEAGELDKARAEAEKHFAAHPGLSQNTKAAVLFQVVVLPRVVAGDAETASKELEALVKTYPESDLAKEAESIKDSIKGAVEVQEMLRDMGGAAEDEDEK